MAGITIQILRLGTLATGWRNARGKHRTPMKNPNEKFKVERVERHIPRANREKLLTSRLSVGIFPVLDRPNHEIWACLRTKGIANSNNRTPKVKTENDFNIISKDQQER
jgi:hypothetical protein